ncbi:MAG: hypothetical protein ABEK59_06975 [Halobacteria archaeon]
MSTVMGAVAEARFGKSGLSEMWLEKLEYREELEDKASELVKTKF